jgi:pilus assembly protein FimV
MRNKTFASLAVASALGLLTPAVHAFGLGKLDLHSALNEPFKAEIAVTALQGEEAETLQVKLASNKEFEKAGLERNFILMGLEFNVVQDNGITYVSVSSDLPIKEPLLDFLIIATTGEGKLIREYTVLLDPPKHVFAKPSKQATTQTKTKTVEKTKPVKKAQTTSYNYGQTTQSTYNSNTYGPVANRDTLWDIALKTRPDRSLSVNQMMVALLDANPDAFHRNNINGLKAGVTLDVPSLETIKQLRKSAATVAVAEQNTQWKNRNKKATSPVATEIVSVETSETEVAVVAEQETTTVDDSLSAEIENEEVTSRLKLVVPKDEDSLNDETLSPQGDDELTELSEQLTFAQETIEAQAQENIDFKARMQAMEEQLETMRRILELKDPDLARLQSMLQEEQASESVDGNAQAIVEEALAVLEKNPDELEPAVEADVVVEDELETGENTADENIEEYLNSLNGDQDVDMVDASVIESAAPEITADEVETDSVVPTVDDVVKTTSELLNIDEAEIQDLIAQVKTYVAENKMTTMLASLLILLAIWLLIRRRNRPNATWDEAIEKYEDGSSSVDIAVPATSEEQEPVEVDEAVDDELDEIVNQKTVGDFIKQADMFVGYADYTQAKSSLEQARLLEPDNLRVASKLCFVLYKQKNVDEFINVVKQSDFDSTSVEWQGVSEWGRELAPENELFLEEELIDLSEEIDLNPEADLPLDEAEELDEAEVEHLEFNLDDFETGESETVSEEETLQEPLIEEPTNDEQLDLETANDDEVMTFDLDSVDESDNEQEEGATTPTFDAPLSLDIESEENTEDESLDVADLSLDLDENDDETLEFESLDLDDADTDDINEQNELAALAESELEQASEEESNSSIVEFEIDDIDDIDEAETKLDLASAYADMGDPDGAKSILEEVLSEGSDEQKSRAQTLLDNLT